VNLQRPNFGDFLKDKKQDLPKDGQRLDEFGHRVSDPGFPVSEDAMELCQKLDREQEKRDQDRLGMFIYNDWNGWGLSEVLGNFVRCTAPCSKTWRCECRSWDGRENADAPEQLKDFNKEIFKKTSSPSGNGRTSIISFL